MGGDVVTGLAQPAHAAAIRMATKLRIVDDDTAPVGGINPSAMCPTPPGRLYMSSPRARSPVQLVQGFRADLPHALARQVQRVADLFQGALVFAIQAAVE
jgi:hypothetical protein